MVRLGLLERQLVARRHSIASVMPARQLAAGSWLNATTEDRQHVAPPRQGLSYSTCRARRPRRPGVRAARAVWRSPPPSPAKARPEGSRGAPAKAAAAA